ncbi:DinB family protein [Spirosoma sp. BT702]|uniref:DinB family protein n=1 Tax=Spirosoma profusum TaxID=2771354 RepID=A0A926XWJ8_9BACT|nr:DinB family protein [Spirosoma profusum]MBD2702083.1 DinB family protein [Spirosoma profusum]
MQLIPVFLTELEQETQTTRKMLQRIPDDKYDWKPHEKSMTVRQLATHIANLPTWVTMAIATDGLDFEANPYKEDEINNTAELMTYLETCLADGKSLLVPESEAVLNDPWTLRSGAEIYFTSPKHEVIRTALNQIVHHRAQMGVFLRLLDIPIPGSYGPSADEN